MIREEKRSPAAAPEIAERRARRSLTAFSAALALLTFTGNAAAQGFGGRPGGFGGTPGGFGGTTPSGGSSKKRAPKKPEEETHAASNAEATQSLQTAEPQLPQNPLEIPKSVQERIGTDWSKELEVGKGPSVSRSFYGLYYQEQSGGYRFRTILPPLWAERTLPGDRASLYGFYFNRRSKEHDADVLFPFFWKLRDNDTKTTVVFPFFHREREASKDKPARHDNWFFPFVFEGKSSDGSGYFHVPPLLTFTQHTDKSGLNIAGPLFCKWKGGPTCDPRTTDSVDMGLAPFYFYGRSETSEYEVIPPLIHYYRYNEIGDTSTNLWGPVLMQHSPEVDSFNLLPLFYRSWGKNESRTTLFPLFHYGYKGGSSLLVTPLFLKSRDDSGNDTFASWLYARYRGRTQLDMVSPLFWAYRDPDIGLDRKMFLPFYYQSTQPRSKDLVIFPLYARFQRAGISDSTWVTPLFRHVHDVTGWETDLFPFFYFGRKNQTTHTIIAPFFWDIAGPHSRTTVAAPFFVRIADDKSVTQVALNTIYREKSVAGGKDWEFHFFPLFSYGESPTGHWWNVLYGLAGYTRDGTMSKVRTLYIPFKLSE